MLPRLNCYYLWTDGPLHCVQYFVHCKHGVITLQVNGDIPTKVKKDAHAVILDFIRSRPPLHPVSLSLVYHWSALSITGQLCTKARAKKQGPIRLCINGLPRAN